MNERRSHRLVDDALATAAQAAREARVPRALAARILAATRPAAAPPPHVRLLDVVLRAAAVAAAFAGVLFLMPMKLEASEFDVRPLVDWNDRVSSTLAAHLPSIDLAQAPWSPDAGGAALPITVAVAAALAGAGLWLMRSERRA